MATTPMPRWATAVSVLLLLWALMGVWQFYSQYTLTPEALAAMSEAERAILESRPGWLWVVFGIAVAAGLVGAIALLMRKAMAQHIYLVSLIAIIVLFGYVFLVMPVLHTIGAAAIPFPAAIIIIAAVSYWLARNWKAKGWIG